MKIYKLKKTFRNYKRGTHFYLIAESEFIGVKEFVFRTKDLVSRISVNEKEFLDYFVLLGHEKRVDPF
ncbi:hypothetical protein ACNRWW_10320 [Metabacillus sp. HB246100]|uniref:hypothetical protein n=1 Tax=Bacillus weihaiensis TaxID=1547283 RepID=UPI002352DE72|nr:hypothetical protein [Bacillus weihaiensis]